MSNVIVLKLLQNSQKYFIIYEKIQAQTNSEMYYFWKCGFWEMKFLNEWRGKSNPFITNDEANQTFIS